MCHWIQNRLGVIHTFDLDRSIDFCCSNWKGRNNHRSKYQCLVNNNNNRCDNDTVCVCTLFIQMYQISLNFFFDSIQWNKIVNFLKVFFFGFPYHHQYTFIVVVDDDDWSLIQFNDKWRKKIHMKKNNLHT